MKFFEATTIRKIDAYTIENEPIASIDLMERAATACSNRLVELYSPNNQFLIVAGPGNNGGDGLAIARQLKTKGFKNVQVAYLCGLKTTTDFDSNLVRLNEVEIKPIKIQNGAEITFLSPHGVIVDALFGSGLSRPLTGVPATLIDALNQLQNPKVSIDVPSGLFCEDNSENDMKHVVKATRTLSLQFPKLSFFFAENNEFTGVWEVLPIGLSPTAILNTPSNFNYTEESDIIPRIKIRHKFDHKGTFGHALLIAGSYGKMGAAVLSTKATLRTGAGLVTTHIPKSGYQIMQCSVPEAMSSLDDSEILLTKAPETKSYKAIGIGPGIGTDELSAKALYSLIKNATIPLLLDADALNILSNNPTWMLELPINTILTPHPGEFARLVGKQQNGFKQLQAQLEFSIKYQVISVLKGAYTCIVAPNGQCWFNSTGNPGMGTGGSGDVLTGMILALLTQGYTPIDAALVAVFLHGRAGDLASIQIGEESLLAGDIIEYIGKAFITLKPLT